MPEFGNKLFKALDRAAATDAGMDSVTLGAEALVRRLQVKSCVEVQCGAVLVELGTDAGVIDENEVDLLRA